MVGSWFGDGGEGKVCDCKLARCFAASTTLLLGSMKNDEERS